MKLKKIKGFKRRDLAKKFGELGFTNGVEIGVCHGTFSKVLCEENKNLELKSVDPYGRVYNDYRSDRLEKRNEYEGLYKHAKKLLEPYNTTIIRKPSMEYAVKVPHASIDFVYIDGSHEFDYVMTDIIEWGARVKTGGIISGHDYIDGVFKCDVIDAVNTYAEKHGIKVVYLTDERTPTWWFTKTW